MSANVTDDHIRMSSESLTQQQVLIVGVVSACVLLLVLVLVIIIFVLVSKRPRQTVRYRSQVSMARSDFWPYTTAQSPSTLSQLYSPDARHLVFFPPPPPAESRASTLDTKRWNEQVARRRSQGHLEMLAASTLRSGHHLTDAPPDYTRSRSMSDGAVMAHLTMHDHMTIFDPVSGLTFVSLQGEDDGVANMIHDFNSTIPSQKGTR